MSTTRAVPRTVVLFEGRSDSLAFIALARRRRIGIESLDLVDLDGITNLRKYVTALRSAPDAPRSVLPSAEHRLAQRARVVLFEHGQVQP